MKKQRGRLTLIEIMIVVAIVGILAAVFIPTLRGGAYGAEMPDSLKRIQDAGVNLIYNHKTGQAIVLPSGELGKDGTGQGHGTGYVVTPDNNLVIFSPRERSVLDLKAMCKDGGFTSVAQNETIVTCE